MKDFSKIVKDLIQNFHDECNSLYFDKLWVNKRDFAWQKFKQLGDHLHVYKVDEDDGYKSRLQRQKDKSNQLCYVHFLYILSKNRLNNPALFSNNRLSENLTQLVSEDYVSPEDPLDLLSQLGTVLLFYIYLAPPPSFLETLIVKVPLNLGLRIDFAMTQLVGNASIIVAISQDMGHDKHRVKKSIKAKTKQTEKVKDLVLGQYYRINRIKSLNPHRITTTIKERLGEKSPSINTIKKYLKEEGKI